MTEPEDHGPTGTVSTRKGPVVQCTEGMRVRTLLHRIRVASIGETVRLVDD